MPVRLQPVDAVLVAAALDRLDAAGALHRSSPHDGDAPLDRPVNTPADTPVDPADLRMLTKHFLALLVARAPGGAVEVRVPPYAVVQCLGGTRHTRGTPPAVVEMDAPTWVALASGRLTWVDAVAGSSVSASGERSDLGTLLPLRMRGVQSKRGPGRGLYARRVTALRMTTDQLRAAVREQAPGVRADLDALVRIPSVSADPTHADDVRRSADATADLFRRTGFDDVRIVSSAGGAPAVVARRPAPDGAPTVLLYAHHDVQPVGDLADWDSEPFEPTERGDRLYGRGAADDKAGIAAHLAALRAHDGAPPVGVTVLVEGEEEIGSPSLEAFLAEHHDLLRADVIVIADSTNWDIGVPALTTTLRGLVDCEVEVSTLTHAVHSGMWGGIVPDALTALIKLLGTLHDDEGNVAVDGLVAGPASDLDYPLDRVRAEAGIREGVELFGTGSIVERLWTRPAITVVGLDARPVADASNTLAPRARATISLRIAPGDDAKSAQVRLEEHLRAHVPWGVHLTITRGETGEPCRIDATGPSYDIARAAFREAWDGTEPVDIGVGGSIPFIAAFRDAFPDAAVLVTGVEDPDTRAHGANEGLHLAEFERVCLAEAILLNTL